MIQISGKVRCKICGNIENNKFYKIREMMFGFKDEFDYFQCSHCGCLQITELPADMSKYYPSNYYSFSTIEQVTCKKYRNPIRQFLKNLRDDYAIFRKGFIGRILYSRFPNRLLYDKISFHFPGETNKKLFTKKSKILDVGCGNSTFLFLLKEYGFNNLLGVDPYLQQKDQIYPNGLKILKKTIDELDEEFDLIMFHHSFEHISDPVNTIQKVSHLLSRKGICLIRIPTVSSFAWEHYRQNWVQIDAPRHFFLHSIASIEILARKAKLTLKKIVYDSSELQFWGSEQYCRDIPLVSKSSYNINRLNSIFTETEIEIYKKNAKKLNNKKRGDQATFYLKKQ